MTIWCPVQGRGGPMERRTQPRTVPSEDVRRHRGDWLVHELTQLERGQIMWTRADGKPLGIKEAIHGRYHQPSNTWDTEAGEQTGGAKPAIAILSIPSLPDIGFPGEHVTVTRGYVLTLYGSLGRDLEQAFREHVHGDSTPPIAWYSPRRQRVIWANLPLDDTEKAQALRMRRVAKHLSDEVPYQPLATHRLDTMRHLNS